MTDKTCAELQAKIRKLEEELSELKGKIEDTYSPLLELTNEAFFLVDKEGTYLFVTDNMAINFNTPTDEIIGKKYCDFHKEDVTRVFAERVAEVFATGRTIADEHKDRFDNKYIYRTFHPIKTPQGEVIKVAVIGQDITARKKIETAVQESEARYRALVESAGEALFTVDRECRYSFITDNLAARYNVAALDVIGKKYSDFHSAEESRIFTAKVAEVFDGGVPVNDEHFGRQGRYVLRYFYPIKTGVPDEKIAGVGILSQDITERKQMEAALRKSEGQYRSLVENAKEGIYRRYRDRFITVNQAFADILGYESPQEFMDSVQDTTAQLFVNPEDRVRLRNTLDEVGFVKDFETEYYRKDGSRVWVSLNSQAIRDDSGQIRYYQGICSDITLRKHLDEELKQSLSLLSASLESTADGLLIVDGEGHVTNCNKKFLRMWNIPERIAASRDDSLLLNHVLGQLLEPQGFLEKVEWLYANPTAHSIDVMEFKDGRSFERYSQPQLLGDKPIGRVWSFRDITQRKLAEQALQESEAKYHDLYENAPDMYYSLDLATGSIKECNETFQHATGYSREELIGRSIFELYDAGSADDAKKSFDRFMATGELRDAERRVRCKDGRIIDVSLNVSGVKNKDGKILYSRSIWRDITERKKYEGIIHSLSITDQLTGLYNRRGFITLAEQQLKVAARTKNGLLFLYADLDGLKKINDTLGHKSGDEAIVEAARVLQEVFRKMDIIARMGGDEFAVLAQEASGEYSEMIKDRLQDQLDLHNSCTGRDYNLSLSIGLAYHDPASSNSLDELISRADSLMYEQKRCKML